MRDTPHDSIDVSDVIEVEYSGDDPMREADQSKSANNCCRLTGSTAAIISARKKKEFYPRHRIRSNLQRRQIEGPKEADGGTVSQSFARGNEF